MRKCPVLGSWDRPALLQEQEELAVPDSWPKGLNMVSGLFCLLLSVATSHVLGF